MSERDIEGNVLAVVGALETIAGRPTNDEKAKAEDVLKRAATSLLTNFLVDAHRIADALEIIARGQETTAQHLANLEMSLRPK